VQRSEASETRRFDFGENWRRFLEVLVDDRIRVAEDSLKHMLGVSSLTGMSFLDIDIGCGSGLFSPSAMRLGAEHVHSFDYDRSSVSCALELKHRYFPAGSRWTIERGDVLDSEYLESLGNWDIIYSWGVLHHTGDMWQALRNVADLAQSGTKVFISIYNDQGGASRRWTRVKRVYNSGVAGRAAVLGTFVPALALQWLVFHVLHKRNPFDTYREYYRNWGMSPVHDWVDWLGGYPFQVATPEQVFEHFRDRGFLLEALKTSGGGLACNEYLFLKQ
jgi:2-polyprenyl-6-hydroxyphenyl methylase/3-demethylubiquinone-9 3-methyltransferase